MVAEGALPFAIDLTQRDKDGLAIQQLTSDWLIETFDIPHKINEWVTHDL